MLKNKSSDAVTAPEDFVNHVYVLNFSDSVRTVTPIDIGSGNTYSLGSGADYLTAVRAAV